MGCCAKWYTHGNTYRRLHIKAVMIADNTAPHMNVPTAIPATAPTPDTYNDHHKHHDLVITQKIKQFTNS